MVLPPRPQNQHRTDRPRPKIDLFATVSPPPPRNLPARDRFAAPPWGRGSPQWIAIDHDLPVDHLARVLDAAYASAWDLVDCAQAGVDLYAPSQENDRTERRRREKPDRQIPKSAFVWLPGEQTYVCPQGHRLKWIGQEVRDRVGERSVAVAIDRCPKEHCGSCPLAGQCTRGANGRTIQRNDHEDLIGAHQAKMATAEAKVIYKQRGQTVELRFADAKAHRGLRRFSSRGLKRVGIEVGPSVLAHNLVVVQTTRQRKAAEATKGTSCQDAA